MKRFLSLVLLNILIMTSCTVNLDKTVEQTQIERTESTESINEIKSTNETKLKNETKLTNEESLYKFKEVIDPNTDMRYIVVEISKNNEIVSTLKISDSAEFQMSAELVELDVLGEKYRAFIDTSGNIFSDLIDNKITKPRFKELLDSYDTNVNPTGSYKHFFTSWTSMHEIKKYLENKDLQLLFLLDISGVDVNKFTIEEVTDDTIIIKSGSDVFKMYEYNIVPDKGVQGTKENLINRIGNYSLYSTNVTNDSGFNISAMNAYKTAKVTFMYNDIYYNIALAHDKIDLSYTKTNYNSLIEEISEYLGFGSLSACNKLTTDCSEQMDKFTIAFNKIYESLDTTFKTNTFDQYLADIYSKQLGQEINVVFETINPNNEREKIFYVLSKDTNEFLLKISLTDLEVSEYADRLRFR